MNRNEFLKSACTAGFCACVGMKMLTVSPLQAEEENEEVKKLQGQLDFIQKRFAKLLEIMNEQIETDVRDQMLESLGRECAKEYAGQFETYKNDLDGFLKKIENKWLDGIEYSDDRKSFTLIGKKTGECFCPFAKKELTSVDFCNCSIGWQKQVYETISGKPVEATVTESVLGGGERCSYKISIIG